MQPKLPLWPAQDNVELPVVQPLPTINRHDPYWKRLKAFFFKRPEYIVKQEYFTYVQCINAWMYCPENFVYDFASVPKAVPFINPAGVFAYPAMPHDFIYRFGGLFISRGEGEPYTFVRFTRSEADAIFLDQARYANDLGMLDGFATGVLRVVGGSNYKCRPIARVDWTKPVTSVEVIE